MTFLAPARHRPAVAAALLTVAAAAVHAQDRAALDPSQVVGNRELPKALYIVPWKKPLPGELAGRPPASVIDEALAPIDRDVFRRQVRYDALEQAHRVAAGPDAMPAVSAAPAHAPAPAPSPADPPATVQAAAPATGTATR